MIRFPVGDHEYAGPEPSGQAAVDLYAEFVHLADACGFSDAMAGPVTAVFHKVAPSIRRLSVQPGALDHALRMFDGWTVDGEAIDRSSFLRIYGGPRVAELWDALSIAWMFSGFLGADAASQIGRLFAEDEAPEAIAAGA